MTDEELAVIEFRETETALCGCDECAAAMRKDVLDLVAEVRRLRGLVEAAYLEGFGAGYDREEPRLNWEVSDARHALEGA